MQQVQAEALTEYGVRLPVPEDRELCDDFVLSYNGK